MVIYFCVDLGAIDDVIIVPVNVCYERVCHCIWVVFASLLQMFGEHVDINFESPITINRDNLLSKTSILAV